MHGVALAEVGRSERALQRHVDELAFGGTCRDPRVEHDAGGWGEVAGGVARRVLIRAIRVDAVDAGVRKGHPRSGVVDPGSDLGNLDLVGPKTTSPTSVATPKRAKVPRRTALERVRTGTSCTSAGRPPWL